MFNIYMRIQRGRAQEARGKRRGASYYIPVPVKININVNVPIIIMAIWQWHSRHCALQWVRVRVSVGPLACPPVCCAVCCSPPLACIFGISPACISPVSRLYLDRYLIVYLVAHLSTCIDLYLAILQQIHCIPLYPTVQCHCIQLYLYVSSCI